MIKISNLSAVLFLLLSACHAEDRQHVPKPGVQTNATHRVIADDKGADQSIAEMGNDSLFYRISEARGQNKPVLLILMHGYGANEDDLFSLARSFPENYIIVSPRAPYRIGETNYQWYTAEKGKDGGPDGNRSELSSSMEKMKNLIEVMQLRYKVAADRTFIAGFSQGANMSYQLVLKHPALFKGAGILSGTIFSSLKQSADQRKAGQPEIFIAHGDQDNRIPYTEAQESKEWLDKHHYRSEFHTYKGMSHSISAEEVRDFAAFIKKNS